MMMCKKCETIVASLMLVVGVLFLLKDLEVWTFWGIQWYTVLFLVIAIASFGHKSCPDCQAMVDNFRGKRK